MLTLFVAALLAAFRVAAASLLINFSPKSCLAQITYHLFSNINYQI
jgi:hypothetical protein